MSLFCKVLAWNHTWVCFWGMKVNIWQVGLWSDLPLLTALPMAAGCPDFGDHIPPELCVLVVAEAEDDGYCSCTASA